METLDKNTNIIQKKHYCGLQGLEINYLKLHPKSLGSQLQGEAGNTFYHYTHKARCGLGLLCKHWDLKKGEEVLVPAYNCGTEIDPFYNHGLNVIFYRINRDTSLDINDIISKTTKKTRLIYVIHYFGWPQNIDKLTEFCKERKIKLVEDCALSLFSNTDEHPIGKLGDAAIYSFPKTLAVPDGGALVLKGNDLTISVITYPAIKVVLKEMLPLIKRSVLRLTDLTGLFRLIPGRFVISRNIEKKEFNIQSNKLPEIPASYYYDRNIENITASRITRFIVSKTDANTIRNRRRENFIRLFNSINTHKKITLLYKKLPEGVCPLFLPILVDKPSDICLELNNRGIAAMQWWTGFHKSFDWNEFPESRYLKEHLLVLPVHQQLKRPDMDYIASQIINIDI